MLIRHNTIGSSAYTSNVLKNLRTDRIPSVLFRSLNKSGRVEDFKGKPIDTFKKFYKKFQAVFAIGLWRDQHDFKRGDDNFVIERAKELQKLYNGKPIYFLPFLEDRLSAAHKKKTFDAIRKVAPNLTLVNNPTTGGEYVQGMLNELHYLCKPKGRKPPQHLMIYCFDGINAYDANFQGWRNKAEGCHMFSIWLAVHNCRLNTNDPTLRPNRNSYPLKEHYEQGEYMLAHPKIVTSISKPDYYKSNADRHKPGKQDPRADTPVFSFNEKHSEIIIFDAKHQKVLTAKRGDADKHVKGNWLYRPVTLKWPFQWADIAAKQSGSYRCTVEAKVGNEWRVLAVIDLSYRDGKYYKDMAT